MSSRSFYTLIFDVYDLYFPLFYIFHKEDKYHKHSVFDCDASLSTFSIHHDESKFLQTK